MRKYHPERGHRPEPHDRAITHNPQIQDFLEKFASALTQGDAVHAARQWGTPALILGDNDERVVVTRTEIENFFGGAKEQYNAQGITDTRPDIQKLEWLTEQIAIVEVRWPYLDAKGEEVGEETSTYVIKRNRAGDLKLRVALMHGAREA